MSTADAVAWMDAAACAARPDLPWLADEPSNADQDAMSGVCDLCPVRAVCAGYAVASDVTGGFWAGAAYDVDGILPMLPTPLPSRSAGSWAAVPLPGLGSLGGAA